MANTTQEFYLTSALAYLRDQLNADIDDLYPPWSYNPYI